MSMGQHHTRSALTAAALLLAVCGVPAFASTASAAVSAEAASKEIGERFDVQVLKVAPGELDGRKVWLVTVMVSGDRGNASFQVHVLAVDQASGALVPSFRHHADGITLPPAAPGGSLP
jgi:hypothetical protein